VQVGVFFRKINGWGLGRHFVKTVFQDILTQFCPGQEAKFGLRGYNLIDEVLPGEHGCHAGLPENDFSRLNSRSSL